MDTISVLPKLSQPESPEGFKVALELTVGISKLDTLIIVEDMSHNLLLHVASSKVESTEMFTLYLLAMFLDSLSMMCTWL